MTKKKRGGEKFGKESPKFPVSVTSKQKEKERTVYTPRNPMGYDGELFSTSA